MDYSLDIIRLDTIDLIYDHHYVSDMTLLIDDGMDWGTSLHVYKENYVSLCIHPNKEFFDYERSLHAKKAKEELTCPLKAWNQPIDHQIYKELLSNYLYYKAEEDKATTVLKVKLLRNNLVQAARYYPERVEGLLGIGDNSFDHYVINAIDKSSHTFLRPESIDYLETYSQALIEQGGLNQAFNKGVIKQTLHILMNALMRHPTTEEHAAWIVDVVKRELFDPTLRDIVIEQFEASFRDVPPSNRGILLSHFEALLPYDNPASSPLATTFAHAHARYGYPISAKFIPYFEKLLDRLATRDMAAGVIADALASSGGDLYPQVERYAYRLLDQTGQVPLKLVEVLFQGYSQNQTYAESLIIDILAEDRTLPTELLAQLIPALPKIEQPISALFIALRLVQHRVPLPENILVDLSYCLTDQEEGVRIMAIDLYRALGDVPRSIPSDLLDRLIALVPGLSAQQYERVERILAWSPLNTTQRTALIRQKEIVAWKNSAGPGIDKEAYSILLKKISERFGELEISSYSEKVFSEGIQRLVEKLGWSAGSILSLFWNRDEAVTRAIISALDLLSDYQIGPEVIDRKGNTALIVLTFTDHVDLLDSVTRIVRDNHFHARKSIEILLSEISELNPNNPRIRGLIEDAYFADQLERIESLIHKQETWDEAQFKQWRERTPTVDDSNLAQTIAVLAQAAHRTVLGEQFYPRPIQLIALLFLLRCPEGGLTRIATGEGKSLIISLLASIKVLQGRQVDIVTSSNVLAVRDALDYKDFYNLLGISVTHNIIGYPGYQDNPYALNIVYGDALHFIGDTLRDLSDNVKSGRGFDLVIIDEVDNLFIDQSNMRVQLSSGIPGFELLNSLLVYMWGTNTGVASRLEQHNRTCYHKLPINDTRIANLTQLDLDQLKVENGETWIPLNLTCQQFLEEKVGPFVHDELLALDKLREKRLVPIPRHLEKFATEQVSRWTRSLFDSYMHREKLTYVIYEPPEKRSTRDAFAVITPVDYENTGAIQQGLQWSDGLHQCLQVKHSLTMYPESLISIFMSYLGFFGKYKGNIFGVTGTLGKPIHHEFFRNTYGVESSVLPGFVQKDITEFSPILTENQEDWYDAILGVLTRKIAHRRAALIILGSIESVEHLVTFLTHMGYNSSQVHTLTIGLPKETQAIKKPLTPGDVIIATNLAGRGMDLKLSRAVIKNGGLHVIVGVFSDSIRVQEQAYGRAARQGEPGSAQFIINKQHLVKFECTDHVDCLKEEREKKEAESLARSFWCRIPYIQIQDDLFNAYVELVKEANSPTGYNLMIGRPADWPLSFCMYLYPESDQIVLKIIDQDGGIAKQLNMTAQLADLDPIAHKHIKTILADPQAVSSSLNQQDYELLHFVAAHTNFTLYPEIYERVESAFEREMRSATGESSIGSFINREKSQNEIYLEYLLDHDTRYTDIKKRTDLDDLDKLQKVEARKRYTLWLEDRKTYNNEYELRQINEYWGQWLKKQEDLLNTEDHCQFDDEKQRAEGREARYKVRTELKKRFQEEFKREVMEQKNQGKLMQNPGYLVLKAWRYLDIHNKQNQLDEGLGLFEGIGVGEAIEEKNGWSFWSSFTSFVRKGFQAFWDIVDSRLNFKGENYQVSYPLGQSVQFLKNATELDAIHSWTADNAMSYIRLIKDGSHLRKIEEAKRAAEVKQNYCQDTAKAIDKIREWVIPGLEAQLVFLLNALNTDVKSDLGIQLTGTIGIYHSILKAMQKNIEVTVHAQGKEMIQIQRHRPLSEITQDINITDLIIERLNRSSDISQTGRADLFNLSKSLNFSSKPFMLDQISASGGILFEISVYELEEDKDWFGVVMVIGIGIACICGGVALLGTGSVFAQSLGLSLLMGGIGDLIQAGLAIIEGRPIDFHQYLNAKGMSIGIAIATAGITSFLGSHFEAIAAFNKGVFGGEGVIGGIKALSTAELIGGAFAVQLTALAATSLLYEVGKDFVDPAAIKTDAENAINGILASFKKEIDRIVSVDQFNHDQRFQEKLKARIQAIIRRYQTRFHDDKTQFGTGTAGSTISHFVGVPYLGNVINTVTRTTMGLVKYREALGRISGDLRGEIQAVFAELPKSVVLMTRSLENSFGTTVAGQLMDAVYASGQVSGGEIDYQHCGNLDQISLSESLKPKKVALIQACEQLKKLFESDHESAYASIKAYFVSMASAMVTHIQEQEVVKSVASGLGAEVGRHLGNQIYKAIDEGIQQFKASRASQSSYPSDKAPSQPGSAKGGAEEQNKGGPSSTSAEDTPSAGPSAAEETPPAGPSQAEDAAPESPGPSPQAEESPQAAPQGPPKQESAKQEAPRAAPKPKSPYQRSKPNLKTINKNTGLDGSIDDQAGQYTVRRGDSLSKIAKFKGTTVKALQEANGIKNPDQIKPGQILNIPGKAPIPGSSSDPLKTDTQGPQSPVSEPTFNPIKDSSQPVPQAGGGGAEYMPDRLRIPIPGEPTSVNPYSGNAYHYSSDPGLAKTQFEQNLKQIQSNAIQNRGPNAAVGFAANLADIALKEYSAFAQAHPLLAEWGGSALRITIEGIVGGIPGLLHSVLSEGVSYGVSVAVDGVLGETINAKIEQLGKEIQHQYGVAPDKANSLATAIALGGALTAGGSVKLVNQFLRHSKLKPSHPHGPPHVEGVPHTDVKPHVDGPFSHLNEKVAEHNWLHAQEYVKGVAKDTLSGHSELKHATDLQKLSITKALQSQSFEKGKLMAGKYHPDGTVFRDAPHYAQRYGGSGDDYAKMKSSVYRAIDTIEVRTHWVENIKTGARYDMKIKIVKIPSRRE